MGRKEMAEELRALRKSAPEHKSVSSMKMFEIYKEIERLKKDRETTPAVGSYGKRDPLNQVSSVTDVKEAKEAGFPTKPEVSEKAKVSKGVTQKGKVAVEKPVKEVKKVTTKKSAKLPQEKVAPEIPFTKKVRKGMEDALAYSSV